MSTFLTAYGLVWFAVLGYVARLGVKQRQLERELERLQTHLSQTRQHAGPLTSKAA